MSNSINSDACRRFMQEGPLFHAPLTAEPAASNCKQLVTLIGEYRLSLDSYLKDKGLISDSNSFLTCKKYEMMSMMMKTACYKDSEELEQDNLITGVGSLFQRRFLPLPGMLEVQGHSSNSSDWLSSVMNSLKFFLGRFLVFSH